MQLNYEKDISGCSIAGIMNERGKRFNGESIISSIATMHERANGLGGGFAIYGIYPDYADLYALHLMYDDQKSAVATEEYLKNHFEIAKKGVIPHRHDTVIKYHPLLRRYFVKPRTVKEETPDRIFERLDDDDLVFRAVMKINREIKGSFVFSSGKNMGIFKGVGYPEEIAKFYRLEEYEGYLWTAHGRFPTNSSGWWGGAHPFGILDWSVVHNGEISSYGINRRYLENFNYYCTLSTDTEVITYLFDLFARKHKLNFKTIAKILAAPFWDEIERMPEDEKEFYQTLRIIYGSALLNGPFSIIAANSTTIVGLNDRIKLRPLIAATKNDFVYLASEESAIKEICPQPDKIWAPRAGEPVIGTVRVKS